MCYANAYVCVQVYICVCVCAHARVRMCMCVGVCMCIYMRLIECVNASLRSLCVCVRVC